MDTFDGWMENSRLWMWIKQGDCTERACRSKSRLLAFRPSQQHPDVWRRVLIGQRLRSAIDRGSLRPAGNSPASDRRLSRRCQRGCGPTPAFSAVSRRSIRASCRPDGERVRSGSTCPGRRVDPAVTPEFLDCRMLLSDGLSVEAASGKCARHRSLARCTGADDRHTALPSTWREMGC